MGKGNMFLGQVRGSVGDVTFSVSRGQQISRVRRRQIGNPRSTGQQIQRMIFASVSWAYQLLKPIANHSFEGVTYGGPSQSKFFSLNLNQLRAWYPKDQAADNRLIDVKAFILPTREGAIGCGLQIAAGTLPEVRPFVNMENGQLNAFGRPVSVAGGASFSIANMLESLGAGAGDQITLVAVDDNNRLHLSRYVINADATAEQLAKPWATSGVGDAFDAAKTNVDELLLLTSITLGDETLADIDDRTQWTSCSIILSRKEGNKWLRSNAWLWNTADEAPQYSAAYALPYWEMSGTDIETINKRYLNNADV